MGNKANTVHRNWNKHQGSPFESQSESTMLTTSSKYAKRLKYIGLINDNEEDMSAANPYMEMMFEDAIDSAWWHFQIMYSVILRNI